MNKNNKIFIKTLSFGYHIFTRLLEAVTREKSNNNKRIERNERQVQDYRKKLLDYQKQKIDCQKIRSKR